MIRLIIHYNFNVIVYCKWREYITVYVFHVLYVLLYNVQCGVGEDSEGERGEGNTNQLNVK